MKTGNIIIILAFGHPTNLEQEVVCLQVSVNDPSLVQGVHHPEELDGEKGRHWLDAELVALDLLDDVDDIEESAELLVVGHEHSPVLEDVVPWYRHEGRGQ